MLKPREIEYRDQTRAEEVANSASHAAGFLFSLVATPIVILQAVEGGDAAKIVGASVFGATMILLYLCSALYHGLKAGRAKQFFLRMDYCSIFLFIAGSYTPFTLSAMESGWGWSIFGVVWALALVGVALKMAFGERYPRVSLFLYLTMGWLSLIVIRPLWSFIGLGGLACLFAGGFTYTAGVVYFLNDHRAHYNHLRWHLFVIGGTLFHFLAIWAYVIG